jgi:hypothetical protein
MHLLQKSRGDWISTIQSEEAWDTSPTHLISEALFYPSAATRDLIGSIFSSSMEMV